MRIDPSDLATFLAIARHRSFRAAATELGVSASALSHALRNIESRLDLRLDQPHHP
jgi:DNA-binding transcriptional LysR family regulator